MAAPGPLELVVIGGILLITVAVPLITVLLVIKLATKANEQGSAPPPSEGFGPHGGSHNQDPTTGGP